MVACTFLSFDVLIKSVKLGEKERIKKKKKHLNVLLFVSDTGG